MVMMDYFMVMSICCWTTRGYANPTTAWALLMVIVASQCCWLTIYGWQFVARTCVSWTTLRMKTSYMYTIYNEKQLYIDFNTSNEIQWAHNKGYKCSLLLISMTLVQWFLEVSMVIRSTTLLMVIQYEPTSLLVVDKLIMLKRISFLLANLENVIVEPKERKRPLLFVLAHF